MLLFFLYVDLDFFLLSLELRCCYQCPVSIHPLLVFLCLMLISKLVFRDVFLKNFHENFREKFLLMFNNGN